MEAKVNNLTKKPSFFEDNSKKTNVERNKNFASTLKTYDQKNNEIDKFQNKHQKANRDRENLKINKADDIKNKKQIKDFEDPIEKDIQNEESSNYKKEYNLFFNLFQNIIQNEDKIMVPDSSLEQDNIKIVDIESLTQVILEETDKSFLEEENNLENANNIDLSEIEIKENIAGKEEKVAENKTILVDEDILGKECRSRWSP